jgi:thioredoxin-related protein
MTNGVALVYFKQPGCPGCEYLEQVTFNNPKVQERLSGLQLYAVDVSRSRAVLTAYADGSFVTAKGSAVCLGFECMELAPPEFKRIKSEGEIRLAVYATPTVLLLEYINGTPYLRGYLLGGLKPADFLKFIEESTAKTHAADATAPPLVVQAAFMAALGAASALSPCVLPPLAVGVLSGRRIRRYFAGLLLGYTAWAVAIAAASAPLVLGKWTAAAILVIFFSLYLLHERLPFWRIQTLGGRLSRKGPLVAGLLMPLTALPCLIPAVGAASAISLMALNSIERFLLLETFAASHASVIYILAKGLSAVRKYHKPLIVTITSVALLYILFI